VSEIKSHGPAEEWGKKLRSATKKKKKTKKKKNHTNHSTLNNFIKDKVNTIHVEDHIKFTDVAEADIERFDERLDQI
jgi:hypothetical protein